ncbi:MAG: ATP-binding cassette domain-containing protein [Fuerstiella sp.]
MSHTAQASKSRSTKVSPAVILDKVSLHSGSVARLQDIGLKIPHGRTAIVGHSGAGKSSLLSTIAGFECASGGQVNLGPMADQCDMPLFWAPQDNGLWPHLTVRQHLTAVTSQESKTAGALSTHDVLDPDLTAAQKTQTSIDKSLHAFDLIHRQSAYPEQLSRGEQNRLSVLRCLLANPTLILLDEPLIHVDPKRQPRYWNLIENHVKGNGVSLIFATHQPEIAIAHSDHCLCLNEGSVDWFGPTGQLYNAAPSQQLAEYLGPNNWFENDEVRAIFDRECEFLSCRPEQLRLSKCDSSALEIIGTTFRGSYAVTELRHTSGQLQKEVIHRPQANVFEVGQFVTLETVVS